MPARAPQVNSDWLASSAPLAPLSQSSEPPANPERFSALLGLGAAIVAAPYVIRTPGLLMPVRNRSLARYSVENDPFFRDLNKYPTHRWRSAGMA